MTSGRRLPYAPALDGLRALCLFAVLAEPRAPGVRVVDLAASLERWPGGPFDEGLRPDGVHFLDTAARELLETLGPEIARAARPPS